MDQVLQDIAIGLAVLFLGFAALVTAAMEAVSRALSWRSGHLWSWIRKSLDNESPKRFQWLGTRFNNTDEPKASGKAATLKQNIEQETAFDKGRIGSIPSKQFARSIIKALVPAAGGETKLSDIENAIKQWPEDVPLREPLLRLVREAEEDWGRFTDRIGEWFDLEMQNLTAVYRRNMRWIAGVLGLVLALILNLNALDAFDVLKNDASLRATGVVAGSGISEECVDKPAAELKTCVEKKANNFFSSEELIQYGGLFDDDDRGRQYQRGPWALLGVILSAVLISFGAPFWRDALSRLTATRRPLRPSGG